MAVGLQVATRFHPDSIEVPGDPERLRHAADRLQDLVTEVNDIAKRLRQADAPQETRGPTVRAMSRVAGTLGQVLEADAEQLTELTELVRRQADLLTDANGTLDDARRRWRQAREELRTEIDSLNQAAERAERERAERRAERARERERAERERGDKGGRQDSAPHDDRHDEGREIEPPTEAAGLIKAMDQQVLDQIEGPLRRLAGLEFVERHGAVAMMMSGKVEHAAERYRQSVQAIFEEVVESLRSVNRVDSQLVEELPRTQKAIAGAVASPGQSPAPDTTRLSLPDDISSVGEELHDCARALHQLAERLPDIRVSIREGRMTPEDERIGSMNGFQRTWNEHFDEVREDLNHARKASADIARQLRELDERGAREVRRTFRGQD